MNCQSREQTEKINGSIDFLTNILSFSTKKCLQPSYFGCRKFNYVILFLRISSCGFYRICSFFVSSTYVWLFIELSEQILFFFVFFFIFSWFWWEIIEEPCISWKTTAWTKKYMVSQRFSHQNHQKNEKLRKNQNLLRQFYKQSYIRAGNEKETESIKNAWTDPGNDFLTINCRAPKIAWLRWLETFFGWKA